MIRFLVLGLLLAPLAQAALVFEQTKVTLEPAKPVDHLDTEFAFKNTGTAAVTVTTITASCGCTVPALEKKDYAAGEKGVLKIRFDVGDRQGPQNRTVTVVTDDGASQTLTLIVNLPLRSFIVPRLLLYRAKDTADKTATITFSQDLPVEITAVTSSDPAFTVTSSVEQAGAVYKLTAHLVNPESATAARATVLVRSRGASGAVSTDSYYLRYEPSAAP
ncbi:MAG: DUF1573 domain-containing protein [Rariglobus sp.]|nr:DUF1573 domain-containing protein [Rariglobus sp.]